MVKWPHIIVYSNICYDFQTSSESNTTVNGHHIPPSMHQNSTQQASVHFMSNTFKNPHKGERGRLLKLGGSNEVNVLIKYSLISWIERYL